MRVQIVVTGFDRMCRGSPGTLWLSSPGASFAWTCLPQLLKGINTRPVTITPLYSHTAGTHQRERQGSDINGDTGRVEQCPSAHLLDTGGARTGETQGTGREEALMAPVIPFDEYSVIATVDGVGNG